MASGQGTPSQVFLQAVTNEVNKADLTKMVQSQQHMLSRFEKTNEMLLNFNSLSASRYEATCKEFKKHTLLLTEMKKDLDSVFRRIRVVKGKLGKQYPEAFKACSDVYNVLEEEEELEEDRSVTPVAQQQEDPSLTTPTSNVAINICGSGQSDVVAEIHAVRDGEG